MDANTIRQKFLQFFARADHAVVRSSSLVPANDPTLYFTNAGMVQFKDVFVGEETRDYSRACSSQKCLRVSGKHNDLESVGRTGRHHTFFEMLGNFSFGDYFKEGAIQLGWSFLVDEIGLDPRRLAVTIFGGDEDVPADEQAATIWRDQIGLEPARIQRLGKADNFWSMGETGPCGPCTEIHYYRGDEAPNAAALAQLTEEDSPWMEVWNLVFMQFNRHGDGRLETLSRTGVDTGMGLERLAAIVQEVPTTYDTDLLRPLIDFIAAAANRRYGDDPAMDVSMRVIADHARATAFCIADGVFPEKGGREYVLRRIMRRAIRHGKLLGFEDLFFDRVCVEVVGRMGQAFAELSDRRELIEKIVQAEERAFRRTLDRGLQKLAEALDETQRAGRQQLSADFVGDLWDTAGFPIDLTRLIAEEAGVTVDEEAAREWVTARHQSGESKIGDQAVAVIFKRLLDEQGPTEFLGYSAEKANSRVICLVREGQRVEQAAAGDEVDVITSTTPFYGRAGGQLGDRGVIRAKAGHATVVDTLKPGGALIAHEAKIVEGILRVGDEVTLEIDHTRRQAIRLNHSATHLLHHALRTVLGPHVAQKGSEVGPDRLRFDFSHFEGLTDEQTVQIERLVNAQIRRNQPTRTEELPIDEARKLGAMALFGEKYGERVRVVRIGEESIELCGGTHVERSGDIGFFRVVSDELLALGVRRIVAVTGDAALRRDQRHDELLRQSARTLKAAPEELVDRLQRLVGQNKDLEREIAQLKQQLATGGGTNLLDQVREVGGVKVLATRVEAADPKTLREAGDTLRDRIGSGIVVLGGEHQGKAALLVMISKDLTSRYHAGRLVGQLATAVGGRGGGRADMAQAGGPDLAGLDRAIAQVFELVGSG